MPTQFFAHAAFAPRYPRWRARLVRLSLGWVLGTAPLLASAADYEPIRVGALEVIPDFNTGVTPTGSVRLANGEEESAELLLFKPRVRMSFNGDGRQFSSTVEVQNGLYSEVGDAGYVDWKVENVARFELDDTRSIRLRTESVSSHDGAGGAWVDNDENDPARFSTSTFDTSFEQFLWDRRGQLVLDARTFSKDYLENTAGVDLREHEDRHIGSSFVYHLLPGADLQMQFRALDVDFAEPQGNAASLDRQELFSYMGASWEPDFDITGKLRLASGYKQTRNISNGTLADTGTWEANLRWQPLEASTLTFAADHSLRDQYGIGSLGATTSYRYNWEHQWARQLKTTLAGSYSRNVNHRTQVADEGLGLKLRLDYVYAAWVNMFVALGHDRHESGGNLGFSQQTVRLGIAASLDRLFGR